MKKSLLTVFLLFAWLVAWQSAIADGGTSCGTATVATQGINHCNHAGAVDQWFTYTTTSDCILTISSCGLTTSATDVNLLHNSCDNQYLIGGPTYPCGSTWPYQSKLTQWVYKGNTVLIRWNSLGGSASYDWSLTEAPLPAGSNAEMAIPAQEGLNSTRAWYNNDSYLEWYTFTPNVDGEMDITNPLNANQDQSYFYYALFVKNGNDYLNVGYSNNYGEGSTFLTAGNTYYIEWYTGFYFHLWNLTFSPRVRAPQPGEACTTALPATVGINSASNAAGPQWFTYTPSSSGVATISTCGLTEADTYVMVYDGCVPNYIARNDDGCGRQSRVHFPVVQGHPYFIQWLNDNTSATYSWSLSLQAYSTETGISSFVFPGKTLSSAINSTDHTVSVEVGMHEDVSSLTPTFALAQGATASVNGAWQESGRDTNDFTSPVVYTVVAEDSTTTTDWTVSVTKAIAANSGKAILAYAFVTPTDSALIDAASHTITAYIPFNQDLTSLVADFSLSAYATASIGAMPQVSGSTANDFTAPVTYTITAEDGATQEWMVTVVQNAVVPGETCSDPIVAVEGENYANNAYTNQYFIYTPTEDGRIGLSGCYSSSKLYILFSDCSNQVGSGSMFCGREDTYIVKAGVPRIIYLKDIRGESWHLSKYGPSSEKIFYYFRVQGLSDIAVANSDDHTINLPFDPTTNLSSLQTEFLLSDGATLYIGDTQLFKNDYLDYTNPFTLTIKAQDGSTQDWQVIATKRAVGTGNSFLQFGVDGQVGDAVIDTANHSITVGVAAGTDLNWLSHYFILSNYASAARDGFTVHVSNDDLDFTNPVTYTITSEAGDAQDWTVTVVEGAVQNIYADITSFRLDQQSHQPLINKATRTVLVYVAKGTDHSALIPTFYLSAGATAKVGAALQESEVTANDFTAPVVYSVTSEDGLTTRSWEVRVVDTETDFVAFSLQGQASSTIDIASRSITVNMPYGSSLANLAATFTLSGGGATAKVGAAPQQSGVTANNFTAPVVYSVTSEDGLTTTDWTVTADVLNGIADNTLASNAHVFPNPSNGQFNVELGTPVLGKIQMDVFSVTGATVLSQTADGSKGTLSVDLSGYQAGIYYLRMRMNGKTVTLKLLRN
ncbi:MAG TPA: T9SS type A sorting domain-containing protein [Williamwhitmania sp.]|nr:T9SS type A sorting domain-containing protein [Williamwhitmania sp.]